MRRQTTHHRSTSPIPADIQSTVEVLGIDVVRVTGDEAWALCPSHSERRPAWSVNLETGEHSCFACGFHGSFLHLVKFMRGIERDPEGDEKAREWIRKRGGIEVAYRKLHGSERRKEKAEVITEADLALFDDPPQSALKDRDVDIESCHVYGVLWDGTTDRWILPVREPYTNLLRGWQEKGDGVFLNRPKNLEKSHTLFGFHLLKGLDTAYLEESPLDCVRLHTYSVDGAVSGYGAAVSEIQMRLLADTVPNLVVCLDNDEAGLKMERRIFQEYRHAFRGLYFADYSHTDKKDHGDMSVEEIEDTLTHKVSALRYRC